MYEAWYNRGNTFYNLMKFEKAIESYDKALRIKPEMHEAWNNKGTALKELAKFRESFQALNQAISFTKDTISWKNHAEVSIILALDALSHNDSDQFLHYLNESRKSEPTIGQEQWMSVVLQTLLRTISADKLHDIRNFITHASLDQQLFPLVRAIDYLETGNEDLIEKLSPEYRKIVMEVANTLKEKESQEKDKTDSSKPDKK
jgi:tetratricopeptide (TPR) repeat protein